MRFTPPLIELLPPQARAKAQRLDADPANAGLMAAAVRYLDAHGVYLRHIHGSSPRHVYAAVPPHIEDYAAGVAEVRRQLDELASEWRATKAAPMATDDLRSALAEALDRIANHGAPAAVAAGMVNADSDAALAGQLERIASGADSDVAPMLVWLAKREITDRISSLIGDSPEGALSDSERDAKFRDIAARRLSLERTEEAIIAAAESAGIAIARRPDAHPAAVLEIEHA